MKRSEYFLRDYAYYTTQMSAQQADDNAMNDALGFPHVDLAYAKATEREQRRMMPPTEVMMARFRADIAMRKYAQAIGV
jgi:hypothetical protein